VLLLVLETLSRASRSAACLSRAKATACSSVIARPSAHAAANGGQRFLTLEAYGIDANLGFGTFTVVGGAGRFQVASGCYEQIITFAGPPGSSDPVPSPDVIAVTISSPGSNR